MPTLQEFIEMTWRQAPATPLELSEPVPVEALPTPALIIDLDLFEANVDKMQRHVEAHGMGLRSHTKMHKCPIIARKQIERGAIGVCAATVSEAEIMQFNGVDDILITSPIVTGDKISRLMDLSERNEAIQIVVDCKQGADSLAKAARERGLNLGVLIDLDPEMGRTGIQPDLALDLARYILDQCPELQFNGLQMYAGHCMHIEGFENRRDRYSAIMKKGMETREAFEREGIAVPVFTGGGTGTFDIEPELGALTDIQAGSYIFMDVEYRDIGGRQGERFDDFTPSLFVLATAISQPQSRLITIDAGLKAFATDTVAPVFRDVEGVKFHWGGDEHGIIQLDNPSAEIKLGDKLPLLASHCDPTVNLYDYYFPYRNGVVEEVWPIAARGRSQ
ncbi:MAG: DSD1 family PLP-dependent enzyme [Pseudomonadales bacterium]|nr:DSD1 family PLP-dependent enzyme [Pseudomonadales bacterium]